MTPIILDPRALVKTEDEPVPPPDVTVPEPGATPLLRGVSPRLLCDIRVLAQRAGGLRKLRDVVDRLLQGGS